MKERVEYRVDSFVDFTGMERKFVMVALSQEVCAEIDPDTENWDEDALLSDKCLSIGVSVCQPEDEFDENMGVQIALGKARKLHNHALYSTDPGLINRGVVNALLDREVAFFKQCPGKYLKGYDTAKAIYEEGRKMVELEASLSDEERTCLDTLLTSKNDRVDVIYDIYNYYQSQK